MKALLAGLCICLLPSLAIAEVFAQEPRFDSQKKRGLYWPPLVSFFLPGIDQWIERQTAAAALYTSSAIFGLGLAQAANRGDGVAAHDLKEYDDRERRLAYGLQLYTTAGELSAFHAFRTAVESRRANGEFLFLTTRETTADLLTAPFAFAELEAPTTFVPLALLLVYELSDTPGRARMNWSDSAFTVGTSYNAGVGEEAAFRGYLMPLLHEKTASAAWSNGISALLFGAAHYSSHNRVPIVQTALGGYLGWLVQRRGYGLRQAVFIHVWWDIIAIGFELAHHRGDADRTLRLPALTFEF